VIGHPLTSFIADGHDQVDDVQTAQAVAQRIDAALSAPYQIGSASVRIGASSGVALSQQFSTVTSGSLKQTSPCTDQR
jgi:predicted signal transduction protein with EAL and GGDEF domain